MSPDPAKVKEDNLYVVTLGSGVRVDGFMKSWWESQQPGFIRLCVSLGKHLSQAISSL